jgi:HD domain
MPEIPQIDQCWAKTDQTTGRPALTVRDHCIIVGAVAKEISDRLPSHLKNCFASGLPIIAALHDIGKLSPRFQLKIRPLWDFKGSKGITRYEPNHAKVSQAFLSSLAGIRSGKNPPDWILPFPTPVGMNLTGIASSCASDPLIPNGVSY